MINDPSPDGAAPPVVVIGAGLAGLVVALQLADRLPVVVLAKRQLTEGATPWAQGGIVGVLGSDDSIDSHVRDTQSAGAGLVDEIVCYRALGGDLEAGRAASSDDVARLEPAHEFSLAGLRRIGTDGLFVYRRM